MAGSAPEGTQAHAFSTFPGEEEARVRTVGPVLVPARDGGAGPCRQEARKGSIHHHHARPVRAFHTQSLTTIYSILLVGLHVRACSVLIRPPPSSHFPPLQLFSPTALRIIALVGCTGSNR